MKFSVISTIFFSAAAVYAAPSKVTPTVEQCNQKFGVEALGQIINQTQALKTLADPLKPNQIGRLLTLQVDVMKLISTVQSATNTVQTYCPQYTDINQALALAQPLLQLPDTVNATLQTFIDKKPVFDGAILGLISLSWLVKGDIIKLHSKVQGLEAAISAIFPASIKTIVDNTIASIEAPFTKAEAAYKNTPLINL